MKFWFWWAMVVVTLFPKYASRKIEEGRAAFADLSDEELTELSLEASRVAKLKMRENRR